MNDVSADCGSDTRAAGHLKPHCALNVAVVGNRRFAKETDAEPNENANRMKDMAADACKEVWGVIAAAMQSVLERPIEVPPIPSGSCGCEPARGTMRQFFSEERPCLRILTNLAAGADQIGAWTALESGPELSDVQVELVAVLPFPEEDYPGLPGKRQKEFREEEAESLRKLIDRPQMRQVIRLDGRYQADAPLPPDDPANRAAQHQAYRQASDMILQNADLLLAIYDPVASGRIAGTQELVGQALAQEIPVVAVLVSEHEARVAVYRTADRRPVDGIVEWGKSCSLDDSVWREKLCRRVSYLMCVPNLFTPSKETNVEKKKRIRGLVETVMRLRLFFEEEPMHPACRCPIRSRVSRWVWGIMLAVATRFAAQDRFALAAEPPAEANDDITIAPYARFYERASDLAGAYMRTYRGAFVLAFTLAGVAVAAAVALMASALLAHGQSPGWAILPLGGLKLGVIIILLVLERTSRKARYQEHAADFRYLAELLRPMQWLAPVGTSAPIVELPAHYASLDPRQSWMQWLFRAVTRSAPFLVVPAGPSQDALRRQISYGRSDAIQALERAASQWVQGQIRYHWENGQKMYWIENGLERIGKKLLWIILVCACAALGLEMFHHLRPLAILLGALAAALPAFIAALGGIVVQTEAKRLRIRSEAMHHRLTRAQGQMRREIEVLNDAGYNLQGGDTWRIARQLRSLAAVMIGETSDWRALYPMHDVRPG